MKAKNRKNPEKLDDIRIKDEIKAIWPHSKKRYGYRKITIELRSRYSENVNHKKVLRMMNGMGIYAKLCGHDKCYSSYRGRVGKVAENILQRDFTANASLQKAGTDVTEFKCDWGKAYLSPVIDFYNDEILSLFSDFVPISSCVSKDAWMMAYVVSSMQEQDLYGTVPKEEKQHAVPHLL